jgi:hypothetical protein
MNGHPHGQAPRGSGGGCRGYAPLKNGHPAHVFTDEDRRRGGHEEIRRTERALFEQLRLKEETARRFATLEARRRRTA